jgi:hypothetical protein
MREAEKMFHYTRKTRKLEKLKKTTDTKAKCGIMTINIHLKQL